MSENPNQNQIWAGPSGQENPMVVGGKPLTDALTEAIMTEEYGRLLSIWQVYVFGVVVAMGREKVPARLERLAASEAFIVQAGLYYLGMSHLVEKQRQWVEEFVPVVSKATVTQNSRIIKPMDRIIQWHASILAVGKALKKKG